MAVKLRNKNPLFLEVRLFAQVATRIELGRANAIAVAAPNDRALFCYWTNLCHMNF